VSGRKDAANEDHQGLATVAQAILLWANANRPGHRRPRSRNTRNPARLRNTDLLVEALCVRGDDEREVNAGAPVRCEIVCGVIRHAGHFHPRLLEWTPPTKQFDL
jgi:hypothetical protein